MDQGIFLEARTTQVEFLQIGLQGVSFDGSDRGGHHLRLGLFI